MPEREILTGPELEGILKEPREKGTVSLLNGYIQAWLLKQKIKHTECHLVFGASTWLATHEHLLDSLTKDLLVSYINDCSLDKEVHKGVKCSGCQGVLYRMKPHRLHVFYSLGDDEIEGYLQAKFLKRTNKKRGWHISERGLAHMKRRGIKLSVFTVALLLEGLKDVGLPYKRMKAKEELYKELLR